MGMTGKEIVETQKKYYLQSWAKQKDVNPIPMEKAEGIYLWDYDGNRYTDMSSTQVNVNLGYTGRWRDPVARLLCQNRERTWYG